MKLDSYEQDNEERIRYEQDEDGYDEREDDGYESDDKASPFKELSRQNSPLIVILLGGILILLIGIFALLLFRTFRGNTSDKNDNEALQQSITDYASAQKQNDISELPQAIVVDSSEIDNEGNYEKPDSPEAVTEETKPTSDTVDKIAVVVDSEDENDISYTKEFILKEMAPYFKDNNLDAVWDLAHLKRYVKLSQGLKGEGKYYYQGDVDAKGLPDGEGLAIYEKNTYYYGSWSHGKREGNGRWYRFYINESDKITKNKRYQAHSYAGEWSNDLPNGEGAEHYDIDITKFDPYERVIQNVVGNFTDGLYDGYMFANSVDYVGLVEEWYGTAKMGVFQSWEDISSIGEYYAWQNRDDDKLYITIIKSDNKNQGMREMLDLDTKK